MSLIQIPIFDGGLITHADPEDIPDNAATESVNFEIDVPGKLVKRQGRGSSTTMTGDHPVQITQWDNPEGTAKLWIYFDTQAKKIRQAATNFGSNTDIKTLSTATDISISNYNRQLRFANGIADKPGVLQRIDRQFFFGAFDVSGNNSISLYDDATPRYPTTFAYGDITTETTSDGTHANGFYYYKFVPVFDGNQEAPFADAYAYKEVTGSGSKTINVSLTVDTDDWNKRITALKLYRSYSATATGDQEPVYYHILTIPVNTKSESSDRRAYTNSYIGNVVYQEGFNFSSYEPSGSTYYWIKVGSDWYRIADTLGGNTNVAIVDAHFSAGSLETFAGFANGDEIWDGSWGIYTGTASAVTNYESASAVASGTNGYAGRNVVFNNSWTWADQEINNDVISQIVTGSTVDTVKVIKSEGKVIQVNNRFTGFGNNITVFINKQYFFSQNGTKFTLNVSDYGLADLALHPLGAIDKIAVNHKYSVNIGGRQFVGNVRLDPDDIAEDHEDWIIYSEVLQPDVLPIINFIQIQDTQGGEITGLSSHLGSLVVFMTRGIYRLDVPSTNPSTFSLLEAEENFGCVAPNSIVQVGQDIFFAGTDNAYAIDSGFNISPITEPIKDVYQAATNIQNSRFFYDPKKNRILCRFGDDTRNIYAFDLIVQAWYKLDMAADKEADIFAIDSDLNVYSITHTS